jgi:hypothetical protein
MSATFPNDPQFEDLVITKVREEKSGWSITRADGWSFFIKASSPVEPKVGMNARFYGDGIGRPVRGVYLDGEKVFYRTAAEDKAHQDRELYGKNSEEWLARWDAGRSVWSIEMGGLGPGYEQCIQITVAEILRHLLATKYNAKAWTALPKAEAEAAWKRDRDAIEKYGFANETVKALGLSGNQWGAALNIALRFYRVGPIAVMADERVKERHIQVSKFFPGETRPEKRAPSSPSDALGALPFLDARGTP